VSHDATRTGAPIALLTILKELARRGEPRFEVLLRGDGELVAQFRALASVTLWPGAEPAAALPVSRGSRWSWWPASQLVATPGKCGRTADGLIAEFRARAVSLVYSNTITNGEVLAALRPLGVPVISHVHELEYWMTHRMAAAALQQAREATTVFIAASKAVAKCLHVAASVPEDRIVTVYESIEPGDVPGPAAKREARVRWSVPEAAFVVGLSGTMDWRKGVDLLAPLAREVERLSPAVPVHWMWVGGEREGPVAGMLQHDFRRCGLESRLHMTGTLPCARDAFAAFDVFALLSREDAFPLVMLEAASIELPILCFEDAGGAPEFVRHDAGFVVPYLDLPGMAARVVELCGTPERRHDLGRTGRRRVAAEHDVTKVAPQILELVQQVWANGRL
jgi:glycosyltransferase involved in cell wall biosynthesis